MLTLMNQKKYKTNKMKDNLININLETSTSPEVKEIRGKDWISFGDALDRDWETSIPSAFFA